MVEKAQDGSETSTYVRYTSMGISVGQILTYTEEPDTQQQQHLGQNLHQSKSSRVLCIQQIRLLRDISNLMSEMQGLFTKLLKTYNIPTTKIPNQMIIKNGIKF
jgi:hypothetical protein